MDLYKNRLPIFYIALQLNRIYIYNIRTRIFYCDVNKVSLYRISTIPGQDQPDDSIQGGQARAADKQQQR